MVKRTHFDWSLLLRASARGLQVSDGAGAVLLMTRREALRRQLPVLGVFRSFAAVGVDPAIMGIGPSVCNPRLHDDSAVVCDPDARMHRLTCRSCRLVLYVIESMSTC